MTTTNIISTPEITGNIGSCKAENTTYAISSFYKQSTTVNSCTGQILRDVTFYDYSYIFVIIFTVICSFLIYKIIND